MKNGDLMETLYERYFQNLSFLPLLLLIVIITINLLGIICKMYVIIDDFVYFNNFCYAIQIPSMLGFLSFIID